MSEILCHWLNEDVQLSEKIAPANFVDAFSNGYLLGELLHKYGLQNDFEMFSQSGSSEARLNNFMLLEPVMALLDVKFDSNMAKDIINGKPGVITSLMYQLFIALGKKTKMSLTGVAMETMRPSGPARLGNIESDMYRERLKTLVPRQVDLHFDELVAKYNQKQKEQEEKAMRAREEEDERIKKYQQQMRQQGLERSRQIRKKQETLMAKIKEATVKIPKAPEQKKHGKTKQELLKEKEIQSVYKNIDAFEKSLKNGRGLVSPESSDQIRDIDNDIEKLLNDSSGKKIKSSNIVNPDANKEYIGKIRDRLNEDANARMEREKRRRRVLVEQMKAHETQEEKLREDIIVNRLMKQSQMERRIAVQLMHVRQEKDVIKQNRLERERQYTERRLKDFQDALEREAEICRQAKLEYADEVRKNQELHDAIARERAKQKYQKHYDICKEIAIDIIDFTCKVGEYRELTENKLPAKIVREWKALFLNSQPLYDTPITELTEEEEEQIMLEESKQTVLDEEDFMEYKNFLGEWMPGDGAHVLPQDNAVLGFILTRLDHILNPPTPPPEKPKFPEFPIKACALGKYYAGKTSVILELVENHRLEMLNVQSLVQEAVEAWKNNETIPVVEQQTVVEKNGEKEIQNADGATKEKTDGTLQAGSPDGVEAANLSLTPGSKTITPAPAAGSDTAEAPAIEQEAKVIIQEENVEPAKVIQEDQQEHLTMRAELGRKAESYLKKGAVIPDNVLVDIMLECVRNIPDGTGWIMDGFPATVQQAKLLEKGLTGYEAIPSPQKSAARETKRGKKSRLAPDPRPQAEAKLPKSGIDVVVLFDIEDEVVLKRAEGRTVDPVTGDLYHEEFNPPPHGAYTGLQNKTKVQTVIDVSNDKEQAQTRLISFQDSWPKLERWFNKFEVLTKVDANKPYEEVYTEIKDILDSTLKKIAEATRLQEEQMRKEEETAAAAGEKSENRENESNAPIAPTPEKIPEELATVPESKAVGEKADTPKSPTRKDGKKRKESPSPPRKGKKEKEKQERTPSPKKRKDSFSSKSPSRKKSRSGSSKSRVTPLPDVIESVQEANRPPSPVPGSQEWSFVEQPLDIEFVSILMSNWDLVESTYLASCKHVFRKIREENQNIYQYFFRTRKSFVEYLTRPDEKQEFVLQWQKDFNNFPEDMRNDDEAKAELHQRVDDLCDRLWDICDCRKEENESERQTVMNEKWLQDRIGLLINHYISLMQNETDRYEQTCKLLRDYYTAMEGGAGKDKNKLISEGVPNFTRLPLVDLPPTVPPVVPGEEENMEEAEDGIQLSPKPSSAMKSQLKTPDNSSQSKSPEHPVEDKNTRIPLVPRRPASREQSHSRLEKKKATPKKERGSEDKLDSPQPPTDYDEKLLYDAVAAAMQVIEQQLASDALESEHDAQSKDKHELTKVASKDKKGGGKKGERKSPPKASKTQVNTPTLQSTSSIEEMSEEEKQKKEALEKMKKEYSTAVQVEGEGLRARVEAIKGTAISVVKKLKEKADVTYTDMDDWLGKRFRQEMESIEQMTELVRAAIESENKLQDACLLEDKDFFIDDDLHVFKTPTPPRVPSPREISYEDAFTCVQLAALNKQFKEIAPSGLIAMKKFYTIMLELPSSTGDVEVILPEGGQITCLGVGGNSVGQEVLPPQWMNLSSKELDDITAMLAINNEYINWKSFLLHLAYPYPVPNQMQLMETLHMFKTIDAANTGYITRDDYEKSELWMDDPLYNAVNNSATSCDVVGNDEMYDRLYHLKRIFFDILCFETSEGDLLDYTDMLLYFVSNESSLHGLLCALGIIVDQLFPENILEEALPIESLNDLDDSVSITQWLQLLNHGVSGRGGNHRFNLQSSSPTTFSVETFEGIYEELGYSANESISLRLLYSHPLMRDLIEACHTYRLKDLRSVFKKTEEDTDIIV